MIAQIGLNIIIGVVLIVTFLIVASFAVGLVLQVIDMCLDTRDELKHRKYNVIEGRRIRKENRVRHIAELEEELGIGDKQ